MLDNSPLQKRNNTLSKQKLAYGIVLAVFVIAYNFIWLNRSYTMSEGWAFFYNGLLEQGKVPYRDFYYYLPPLNLLIDYIIWKISTGYFFVYRLVRLAERVLIAEIMYKLISKRVDPFIASAGCFIATALASANFYDLVGDYNQTVQLLVALLCVLVLKYSENLDNVKRRSVYMFAIGICGGLMFLSKQTIVVASALTFVGLILFLVIIKKEKNLFRMIISVGLGLAVPVGIAFVYMVLTHSLTEFIDQVFIDTSSKGSLYDIVVGTLYDIIKDKISGIIAVGCIFAVIVMRKSRTPEKNSAPKAVLTQTILLCVSTLLLGYKYYRTFLDAGYIVRDSLFLIPLLIILAVIIFVDLSKLTGRISIFVAYAVLIALLFVNYKNITSSLYRWTGMFAFMTTLLTFIYLAQVIWVIYQVVCRFVKKTDVELDTMIIVCSGLASSWSTVMSSGECSVLTISAFISFPAFVYLLFKDVVVRKQAYAKALIACSMVVLISCTCQKIECNYSWWGDTEASFFEKTEKSDIRALKGFRFSKEEYEKYDKLCEVIKANTDEDSVIFGFPYVKTYNVFLENYNMDNFVPVLFYDVCADDYAEADAKTLAKNPPDIVVWLDIPYCMETHEAVFRDGELLGQRKIQKWFSSVVDKDYTIIGQVGDVYVYKLNASGEPTQTFIKREDKVNHSIEKKNIKKIYNDLEGKGTKKSPYLVSSAKDLVNLRNLVNDGNAFYSVYFRQTCDIDLSGIENWRPIGIKENQRVFGGIYDGGGYKISNLNCEQTKNIKYTGLFGALSGTVKNVALVDCNVNGKYAGGIAAIGKGGSSIVNCSVSGNITGKNAVGGIASSSVGAAANCVSTAKLKLVSDAPKDATKDNILSTDAGSIFNCYSVNGNYESETAGNPITSSTADELNDYRDIVEKKTSVNKLVKWQDNNGVPELTNE